MKIHKIGLDIYIYIYDRIKIKIIERFSYEKIPFWLSSTRG